MHATCERGYERVEGGAHTSISRKFSGGPYSSSKDCWRASGMDCIVTLVRMCDADMQERSAQHERWLIDRKVGLSACGCASRLPASLDMSVRAPLMHL